MTRSAPASRWLSRLLGPVLLGIILATLEVDEIATALERASVPPIVAACLAVLPTFPLRSWRWRILLEGSGVKLGAVEALNAYAFSIVVGAATPGRLGELIKISYLRNKGVATSVAVLSVGLDRLFDVLFLFVVGVGAAVGLVGGQSAPAEVAATLAAAAAIAIMLRYANSRAGRRVVDRSIARLLPETWARQVGTALRDVSALARGLPPSTLVVAALLTAITWVATYFAVYLCAVALGLAVPFLDICGVTAISSLVTFLPISILGLGTRDLSLIALLAPYGVAPHAAVALSALFLGITLWVVLVCSYSLATPAAASWRRGE